MTPAENVNKKLRATVYIDGFNWYYGIFRHRPEWKWLNVRSFFEELRLHEDLRQINFFTALVEPHLVHSPARNRQELYLVALETLPAVRIIKGTYRRRKVRCGARCKEEYETAEEKKTDVNIAVQIINDAVFGVTDSVVLVSGDSDLQPAMQWVRQHYPAIKLTVYVPALESEQAVRGSRFYGQHNIACKFLPTNLMDKHQLPAQVPCGNGNFVQRPELWRKVTR